MKMKFFVIIFAAFAIEVQCRSLSNVRDAEEKCYLHIKVRVIDRNTAKNQNASNSIESTVSCDSLNLAGETIIVNMPEQLKELIALYEENFEKLINFAIKMSKNKDNNKQEIHFLKQLSSLIEQLVQEQSKVTDMHAKFDNDTDSILQTLNSINNIKELINTVKEIDIVYQDGEITDEHIRIKRATEGHKRAAIFATSEERMTNMLIDIQRQVVQIRKNLDKLCKKHHPTSTTILEINHDDETSPVDQPNNVAIM